MTLLGDIWRRAFRGGDVARPAPGGQSVREYVAKRAKDHGLTPEDIRGPRRFRHIVDVRYSIASELRENGMSLPEIGKALGNRDHTTIISLLRRKRRGPSEPRSPGITEMAF